ncbi:Lug1 protein [Saccharomycopsis crataegensis]|uniref:Lug1 protein n=1 Tax=Saccharomycopsis crataegensis TaxID=43959 RepID=A0AAV5QJS6_9ASCO|nr:Lug1 protein [Saccharomycopsis crataegensis]
MADSLDHKNTSRQSSSTPCDAAAAPTRVSLGWTISYNNQIDHPRPISSLNDLPIEVLNLIVAFTYSNDISISFSQHLEWFAKEFMLVNKTFYFLALKYLCNYCRFSCPQTFHLFNSRFGHHKSIPHSLDAIGIPLSDSCANLVKIQDEFKQPEDQSVYSYVKVLDLQEFTSVGLGRTNRMNNEIDFVTHKTILGFLEKATNLREFLSSENIQNDISPEILIQVFFNMPSLESIDFCGSTGTIFSLSFSKLLDQPSLFFMPIVNLKNLSFHDCVDVPSEFFAKLFPLLTSLEKLDLFHTQITGDALLDLDVSNLTHISLGCCYKLDKRYIMEFFRSNHHELTNLKWLSLETDNVNDMNEREMLLILKFLATADPLSSNTGNFTLQYLNLSGRQVSYCPTLQFIKSNFIILKSLHIQNSKVTKDELVQFLSPPSEPAIDPQDTINSRVSTMSHLSDYFNSQSFANPSSSGNSSQYPQLNPSQYHDLLQDTQVYQQLRFINVKANQELNRLGSLENANLIECCPSLLAWEFDSKLLENAPNDSYHYQKQRQQLRHHSYGSYLNSLNGPEEEFFWKLFPTTGRRSWLYKLRSYNSKNSKYLNYHFNFDRDYHPHRQSLSASSAVNRPITQSLISVSSYKSITSVASDTFSVDFDDEPSCFSKNNGNAQSTNNADEINSDDLDLDYEILTHDPNYIPNITQYDIKTGKKIQPKVIFYPFLKYASKKIDMSNGPFYEGDSDFYKIWPVKFSERGIYKYYALNV